jgi:hypothetical protein
VLFCSFKHPNPSFKRDCLRSPLIQTLGFLLFSSSFFVPFVFLLPCPSRSFHASKPQVVFGFSCSFVGVWFFLASVFGLKSFFFELF